MATKKNGRKAEASRRAAKKDVKPRAKQRAASASKRRGPVLATNAPSIIDASKVVITKVDPSVLAGLSSNQIKALAFDVFGTIVDWRASVIKEAGKFGASKGISLDWEKFADAWVGGWWPAMDAIRNGQLPWMNFDDINRMILEELLVKFNVKKLTDWEKKALNRVWHRLQPWPDSVAGLARLRKLFIITPLSNGNIALVTEMAKNAGLPWDCILSSELAKHYKPDAEVYQKAAELLCLEPKQIMMVAAHKFDLNAAKALGFKTAFIQRPLEYGPSGKPDTTPDPSFDYNAKDLHDLADKLGA